jgi:hypothetical protein
VQQAIAAAFVGINHADGDTRMRLNVDTVLRNPFRRRPPDSLSDTEVVELFARPSCYEEFMEPQHLLVLGGRGTGKSMLLRSVSLPVYAATVGEGLGAIPFYGVYVPVKQNWVKPFQQLYDETLDEAPFSQFMTAFVLFHAAQQLAVLPGVAVDRNVATALSGVCPALRVQPAEAPSDLGGVAAVYDRAWQDCWNTVVARDAARELSVGHCVEALSLSLARTSEALWRLGLPRVPVALLLDGLDAVGPIAPTFLQLMRKENLDALIVKVGVFTLENLTPAALGDVGAEYASDYRVICIEPELADDRYAEFAMSVLQKRWGACIAEGRAQRAIVPANVCDVFPGTRDQYTGLDALVRLSSGNIQCLLELCEMAWDNSENDSSGQVHSGGIQPKHQTSAVERMSSDYYGEVIPVQAREFGLEAQSLVYQAGTALKSCGRPASTIRIPDVHALDERTVPVLRRAVSRGILQPDLDERVSTELSDGYVPQLLRLNGMLLPKFGLPIDAHDVMDVSSARVTVWCQEPAEGQLDFFRGGRRPAQGRMFDTKAFLSAPMRTAKRPKRNKRLLGALHGATKLRIESDERLGQSPKWRDVCEDVYDLQLRGDFSQCIHDVIRNAYYVVHDVTDLTPGVSFELGLSMGEKRPYFLIWDRDEKPEPCAPQACAEDGRRHWLELL